MPLQQNKRSLLQKILSGGAQGASQALLLQSLLGQGGAEQDPELARQAAHEAPQFNDFPNFQQDGSLGAASQDFAGGPPGSLPPEIMAILQQSGGDLSQLPPELLELMQRLGVG